MPQGTVVQGSFPNGLRIPAPPASAPPRVAQPLADGPNRPSPPPLAWPRTAMPRTGQPEAQPRSVHPRAVQPRRAEGQGPVRQRVGNGEAFQLPANLSSFGGGGGQPLPPPVRQKMESFFNASFADVRVHVGAQASAIGALAFTHGSNLYFAPGQYNPGTPQGQQLLGHELAHVLQQRSGKTRNPFGSGVAVVQDRALETEAERLGTAAAAHHIDQATPQETRRHKPAAASHAAVKQPVVMRKVGFEFELGQIKTEKNTSWLLNDNSWTAHSRGEVIVKKTGYDITADIYEHGSQIEFILHAVDENTASGRQAIVNAANSVMADIQALTNQNNIGEWVRADRLPRINGSRWHRFKSDATYNQIAGQLQMTAGVKIDRLRAVVSGAATENAGNFVKTNTLGNYRQPHSQPMSQEALAATTHYFPAFGQRQREILASVITLVAQVPLTSRASAPGYQGTYTAKTDFSKILKEAAAEIGRPIDQQAYVNAVLRTINHALQNSLSNYQGGNLTQHDRVFANNYVSGGVAMNNAPTLGLWLRSMVPTQGYAYGWWQGTDLMTPQHYPGDEQQRGEMRAFGRFGSKTDSGGKVIIEWRNLQVCYPQDLATVVAGMVDYVRQTNNDQPQTNYLRNGLLVLGAAYALYHATPIIANRLGYR